MPLPIPPNVANNPQPICIIPHKNVLSVTCGLPRHLISYPGYPSLPVCRGRSGCVYGLSFQQVAFVSPQGKSWRSTGQSS